MKSSQSSLSTKLIIAIAMSLLVATHAAAATWYVLPDGSGDAPTIQAALDACAMGDTVLVAVGTYHEHIVWPATQSLVLTSESGPEATVIDGSASGRVITMNGPLGATTKVCNLTIQNGYVTGTGSDGSGAGIACYAEASPTIEGNIITDNTVSGTSVGGAGIACQSGVARILENTITDNTINSGNIVGGAGILLDGADAVIIGNTISHNAIGATTTSEAGGGISVTGEADPWIEGNTITDNNGQLAGGGIYLHTGCGGKITGNTITHNIAENGAGVALASCHPTVSDNVIMDNVASLEGGGIKVAYTQAIGQHAILVNNDVLHNTSPPGTGGGIHLDGASPRIEYCNIEDNGTGIFCGPRDGQTASPLIRSNTIHGNLDFGLTNVDPAVTVDAIENWWGDDSGPHHDVANPAGLGDRVSDNVAFNPWLTAPHYMMLDPDNEKWYEDVLHPGRTLHVYPDGMQDEWTLMRNVVYDENGAVTANARERVRRDEEGNIWRFGWIEAGSNPTTPILYVDAPLYVGRTWTCVNEYTGGATIERIFTCTAESTVTVPFGPVQCFMIEMEQHDDGVHMTRTWYADGIGRVKHWDEHNDFDYELFTATITPTAVEDFPAADTTVQLNVKPNPFNPRTTVGYDLARQQEVKVAVYDLRGRRVRELDAGLRQAGKHRVIWDGTDDTDRSLPSGVYFVRLVTDTGVRTQKVSLIR